MDATQLKRQAAERAVEFIESGMIIGLGHGSTAIWATRRIAELIKTKELKNIIAVPCSLQTEEEAKQLGIPLTTLDTHPVIDITIDGADEVAPSFDVIKGGGGALLREKIVAQASRREIIVVDESKVSSALGTTWAIPVEVIPFGSRAQQAFLESLGAIVKTRVKSDGSTFITDQGNIIMDCKFGPLGNPAELAEQIKGRTGVVEHGLFINLVSDVIVAASSGTHQLKKQS